MTEKITIDTSALNFPRSLTVDAPEIGAAMGGADSSAQACFFVNFAREMVGNDLCHQYQWVVKSMRERYTENDITLLAQNIEKFLDQLRSGGK